MTINNMPKVFFALLASILLLGGLLRFTQLGAVPVGLYWDEIAMFVDARSVAATGLDMHGRGWFQTIFPSYGDYKLPVYIWAASVSFALFGSSEWALRLPSALAGLGTIVLAGWVASELWKQEQKDKPLIPKLKHSHLIFLATSLVIAVSPWSVLFSRTAFEGHLGQFLLVLSVLLLVKSKSRWWLVVGAVIVGALATYTYFSIRFVWPVLLLGYQILFNEWHLLDGKKLESLKKDGVHIILKMLLPLILFFALLIPMMQGDLYDASNRFRLNSSSILNTIDYPIRSNQLREVAGNSSIDRVIFHRHYLLLRELFQNYSDHLNLNFLFVHGDSNLRHGTTQHGLFLFIFLPFFILGGYSLAQNHPKVGIFLLLWWLAAVLPAAVPDTTPHALRTLNALVPLSIIIGIGISIVIEWLCRSNLPALMRATVGLIIGLLFGFNLIQFSHFYFVLYPSYSATEWQGGFKEIAQTLLENKESVDTTIIAVDDVKFYLWLLAYGPYSQGETQEWESRDFKFDQGFDDFIFNFRDLSKELASNVTVQWVGVATEVPPLAETVEILQEKLVQVPSGKEYKVLVLRNRQP